MNAMSIPYLLTGRSALNLSLLPVRLLANRLLKIIHFETFMHHFMWHPCGALFLFVVTYSRRVSLLMVALTTDFLNASKKHKTAKFNRNCVPLLSQRERNERCCHGLQSVRGVNY